MVIILIALKAKYLLDGTGSKPIRDPIVTIENGKIIEVSSGLSEIPPQGAQKVEFSDGTILPGMINLHAHLTGTPDGRFIEHMRDDSDNILTLKAENNARTALRAGVTTIRDCGGRNRTTLDLKKAMDDGVWSGPRLFVCGRPLTTTGGHGRDMAIECDGTTELRKAVRGLVQREGVDFIKVIATGGGTPGTDGMYPSFSVEELKAIVDEAHNLGRRVVAHAAGRQGVLNAVESGIDELAHVGLKHPSDRDGKYHPEIGKRIADSRIIVHFTMRATYTRFAHLAEDSNDYRKYWPYFQNKLETLGHLKNLGVRIGAGDDAGWSYVTFDGFVEELQLMTRGGMTPLEAIAAATGVASQALGMENKIGTIEVGKIADLIVVRGEPFLDLQHLRNVQLVMKEGSVVHQM